jgi:hypothetical protein
MANEARSTLTPLAVAKLGACAHLANCRAEDTQRAFARAAAAEGGSVAYIISEKSHPHRILLVPTPARVRGLEECCCLKYEKPRK